MHRSIRADSIRGAKLPSRGKLVCQEHNPRFDRMSTFDDGGGSGVDPSVADSVDLRAQIAQLKAQNAQLDRFASAAAHELSEPLRVIAGYASLLSGEGGGAFGAPAFC